MNKRLFKIEACIASKSKMSATISFCSEPSMSLQVKGIYNEHAMINVNKRVFKINLCTVSQQKFYCLITFVLPSKSKIRAMNQHITKLFTNISICTQPYNPIITDTGADFLYMLFLSFETIFSDPLSKKLPHNHKGAAHPNLLRSMVEGYRVYSDDCNENNKI